MPVKKKTFKKKRGPKRFKRFIKRHCVFCQSKTKTIDYKDIGKLQKFTTERGKILPSRVSGNCPKHQREIARAIKKARAIALMPYVAGYR